MLHGPEKAFLLALFWIRVLNRVYAQGSHACLSLVAGGSRRRRELNKVSESILIFYLCASLLLGCSKYSFICFVILLIDSSALSCNFLF